MEEDILRYAATVMFRGMCMYKLKNFYSVILGVVLTRELLQCYTCVVIASIIITM